MTEVDPFIGARAALLDHLPKAAILARYQVAGGQELVSGKFANRAELADVACCNLSYAALLQHWSGAPPLADHAAAVAAHFQVGVP